MSKSSHTLFTLSLVIGYVLWLRLSKQEQLRLKVWKVVLLVPVLSEVLILIGTIRFGQTLASLLETGYNIINAITLAAHSSGDPVLTDRIENCTGLLKDGETLANSLRAVEYFPRTFIETVKTGEEVGNPGQMLKSYVMMSQTDLDYRLEVFTNALEPLFMLAVGGVVGFISIAALMPMLKLIETL